MGGCCSREDRSVPDPTPTQYEERIRHLHLAYHTSDSPGPLQPIRPPSNTCKIPPLVCLTKTSSMKMRRGSFELVFSQPQQPPFDVHKMVAALQKKVSSTPSDYPRSR
jgi:hypothetical protein